MSDTPLIKHNYLLISLFLLALIALIYQLATSMVPDAMALLYGIQNQTLEISYQTHTLMMPSIFFAISGIYCIFIMPLFKPERPFKFIGLGLGFMVIALSLFLAARFLGPVMVTSWLAGHGYSTCEQHSQSDTDISSANIFVKHPTLCTANITLDQGNGDKVVEALHLLESGELENHSLENHALESHTP